MSSTGEQSKVPPMKLLPHQAAFVKAVLDAGSKRVTLLRADVGLGKSTALAALATRLQHEHSTARTLFLTPAALRRYFVEALATAGTPALLVDRNRFRKMIDSDSSAELWPLGVVAVLSPDFARQVDILDSLASTRWDLVIADEAHSFRGARAELLRRVGAVAERLVLATAFPLPDGPPTEDANVVHWRRNELVDHDGKPLDVTTRPVLHEIGFDLTQDEKSLMQDVVELCRILETGTPEQTWRANLLLASFRSSPAALEGMLRRLEIIPTLWDDAGPAPDVTEDETESDGGAWSLDNFTAERMIGIVIRALQEMEAIKVDSKVSAFSRLLDHLRASDKPNTRVCVTTSFLSTCFYLAAEIESRGLACQLLHGGMSSEDRLRSVTTFSTIGGIMVATSAVITIGLDFSNVTDLVLYDVPSSQIAMAQTLGRFDRYGRKGQLNVHVLVPSNDDSVTSNSLGKLRQLIKAGTGA